MDPSNAVLYSNRSASEASLGLWESALEDSEKAIELRPDWSKGYSRRGTALNGLGMYEEALGAFDRGLELEPSNVAMHQGREMAQRHLAASGSRASSNPFADPNLNQRLQQDPRTAAYMKEADFLIKLEEIKRDPQAFSRHINDKRFLDVLSVLLGGDVHMQEPEPAAAAPTQPQPAPTKPAEEKPAAPALTPEQEKAQAAKELGNAAYKQRDFATALEHYEAAFSLDPTNAALLANKSAVLFEESRFEECIRVCEDAVILGREHHAEFKLIGRLLGRIGSCHERLGDLDAAIKYYGKSLTEARNPEIAEKLKAAERAKTAAEKAALYNPELAEKERQAGNEAFAKQDYATAVKHYTEAIRRDERDPRAYSNRAACYLKLAAVPEGLKDAERCLELDPTFVKGYLRKAALQAAKREWTAAIATCEAGVEHDPEGKHRHEFQQLIARCYSSQMTGAGDDGADAGLSEEERAQKAMQNPEVQELLRDPAMQLILRQMQSDPAAAREHMKNPQVAAKIQKLVRLGVLRTA